MILAINAGTTYHPRSSTIYSEQTAFRVPCATPTSQRALVLLSQGADRSPDVKPSITIATSAYTLQTCVHVSKGCRLLTDERERTFSFLAQPQSLALSHWLGQWRPFSIHSTFFFLTRVPQGAILQLGHTLCQKATTNYPRGFAEAWNQELVDWHVTGLQPVYGSAATI